MGLPETGEGESIAGQWYTVQPGLPDDLTDALAVIQGLVEALLVILNTVLTILQVVKALLIGLLDPLAAIIDAIIDEIQSLLDDIRNIGIYITYDDVTPTHEQLLGGYQAYERRMIGRLVNRNDPSRPDFSPSTGVLGIFIYASADSSSIQRLIATIQKILAFFGQQVPTRAYTVPTNLQATYGIDGYALNQFGSIAKTLAAGETPDAANVTWSMAPPPSQTSAKFPWLAPKGFLVEVSTVPDGLLLAFDTVAANIQPGSTAGRSYGLLRDPKTGAPFKLYGGTYMLDVDDLGNATYDPNQDFTITETRIYGMRSSADNVPIPIDLLYGDTTDTFYLQRTFFVSGGTFKLTGPGQSFATTLKAEDMPYNCDFEVSGDEVQIVSGSESQAETVFVRISAVTEAVADEIDESGPLVSPLNFWRISSSDIIAGAQGIGYATIQSDYAPGDKTEPSSPLTLTFPASSTQEYLNAVTTALVVLALSRSDLPASYDSDRTEPSLTSSEAQDLIDGYQSELSTAREQLSDAQESLTIYTDPDLDISTEDREAAIAEINANIAALEDTIAALEDSVQDAEGSLTEAEEYESTEPPFLKGKAGQATGLEDIGQYLMFLLFGRNPERYFRDELLDPASFREDLLKRARRLANHLYQQTGPLGDLEEFVVEQAEPMLSFKWSDYNDNWPDMTILESLESSTTSSGIGVNPVASGYSSPEVARFNLLRSVQMNREPGFLINPQWKILINKVGSEDEVTLMGRGSADYSPVAYDTTSNEYAFCRNVFFEAGIYSSAATVLNIAASTSLLPADGGAWKSFRLFPQGLPAVERALEQIIAWAETLKQGISGVVEVILAYIEFLEARILELQNFILRLNGLLDLLLNLDLPSANALVVTANGTSGLVSEFVSAGNKPSDSASITSYVDEDGEYTFAGAYGAGIVLVAGGLPSLMAELLKAFFPELESLS